MRYIVSILSILCVLSLLSCRNDDLHGIDSGNSSTADKAVIEASCSVAQINSENSGNTLSRGIIGQFGGTQLAANFIKLDEKRSTLDSPDDYEPKPFEKWDDQQTQIVNANVFTSTDNTGGLGFRSVSFTPRLTYPYDEPSDTETVGYITRMVGWYPRTYEVPVEDDGVDAFVPFVQTESYSRIEKEGKTYDCVVFKKKLDGKTDLMMTDMREGRYDLSEKGFKNNVDNDYDVQPYGHLYKNLVDQTQGYQYCNYFSFKHYLTAVRLFIKVEDSDLNLISWKSINDIIFMDQPQTVTIALPEKQMRDENAGPALIEGTTPTLPVENVVPVFGEVMEWDDRVNMPIIRDAMAENYPGHPEFADVPTYPLKLENAVKLEKTYMGYILLEPGKDVDFEIHTDAGVFKGYIPHEVVSGDVSEEILKAGNIYNIVIDLKDDGGLDIVVGNEDFEMFRNLTPFNNVINDFEYSNCFIISQDMMKISENDWYEGFYFYAMTPGRGERGMISGSGAKLYPNDATLNPHSVRILWQDVPYLVTYVELVHGYIRFTLNKKCRDEGLQGNAVIVALDENGDIIWSWHIWVNSEVKDIDYTNIQFNDPENSSLYGATPNSFTPKTLSQISIMNMNLGATKALWSGDKDPLECYGLYYQWGRKDPSPLPPSYNYGQSDMTTKEYYYMDEGVRTRVYRYLDLNPTVEISAKHPMDIVAPSQISETYANDWLFASIDQLWGYSPTEKRVVMKTIYDPCPYGYRVADDELFALSFHAYNNGKYYVDNKGIIITVNEQEPNYFPFSGWRGHDRSRTDKTNAWYEVGNLGDYQDARVCKNSTTYMNHRGRSFFISKSKLTDGGEYIVEDVSPSYKTRITNDYANRASASPVRCVRYNANDEEPAATTASENQ